jgi:mRNA interferase MazF
VLVAPMTIRERPYPTRIAFRFQKKDGTVVLDQLRTVDGARLVKKLGSIDASAQRKVLATLAEMFAP